MQNEWLSSDEACAYAGVTERTLRKWAIRGLLERFAGPSGRPTYRRDQLDEALARNKRQPRPEETTPPLTPPPQTMHEAAAREATVAQAQETGHPQFRGLLEQSDAACPAEEALARAREEIRWLRERVERSEQERAELLRLILTDR
jgi:hypothetical protein